MTNDTPRKTWSPDAARRADLPGLQPCSNNALRKATRQIGQLYDGVIASSGLRAAQFGILVHIAALDAPMMTTLARALVMDLSALGHTLKPLVRDGYVILTPDANDRRAKRVSLTVLGEAKQAEAAKLWRDAQDRFEAAFGAERAEHLREALGVIASEAFSDAFNA